MYNVTIFGIDLSVDPIAFKLPIGESGWTIYWYGIIIALGFVLAIIYGYLNAKRFGIDVDRMLDVVLVATPCAILGARTYYVLFDGVKIKNFSEFFGFGGSGISGLAIYGGVIGAVIAGVIMARVRKVKILDLLDMAAIAFLIGQGIGRWGNFFNQEAFGGPTGSDWWGMTSENVISDFRLQGFDPAALAHPCFLYESIWCISGAVLLHFLSKKRRFSGEVAIAYCAWYGFGRAIIETMRTDSLMIGPLKVSFLLSLLICIGALAALFVIGKRRRTAAVDVTYESMFKDEMQTEAVLDENEAAEEEITAEESAEEEN
ncbi:MAG: prolipoprotein diacylglyceryl transferase [Acutalibacteraceae bacterium]|nr:prolipoprotein diacylglyceryl transferase [Acutalibacteraceae bacterium]